MVGGSMDLSWLANYPPLSIAANLTGVVGFGLAIFFYFRAKERFAISYKAAEKVLIQPSTSLPFDLDVPLSWNGTPVARLTRTYILITNTGNKLIERNDIVGIPSIRVSDNSEIIESELVVSDDPGSRASISSGSLGPMRAFDFEFLRPSDGFILKVDHTGALNELFIECKSKAGGPIKKVNQTIRAVFWAILLVLGIELLGYAIWPYSNLPEPFSYQSSHTDAIEIVMASFLLGSAFIALLVLAIALVSFLLSLVTRKGKKENKRSWVVFVEIGNNSKNALS